MKRATLISSLYLVVALLLWVQFIGQYREVGAQALGNLGLVAGVLPVALLDFLGVAIFGGDAILNWSRLFVHLGLPDSYVLGHAYYYFPRVIVIAASLFALTARRA